MFEARSIIHRHKARLDPCIKLLKDSILLGNYFYPVNFKNQVEAFVEHPPTFTSDAASQF